MAEEMDTEGVSVEVVDPRTLVPIDEKTIKASVRETGRVVIVDEACLTCGAAAEAAIRVRRAGEGKTWASWIRLMRHVGMLQYPSAQSPSYNRGCCRPL